MKRDVGAILAIVWKVKWDVGAILAIVWEVKRDVGAILAIVWEVKRDVGAILAIVRWKPDRQNRSYVPQIAATLDGQAEAERRGARLEALVFPSEPGGYIDEHNLRRRIWLPLLAAAELRHTRIHDLRHGYASLLIEAGAELQYVQGQLGHHSAAFTLRIYGHLLPRDRRGYVDRLDSISKSGTSDMVGAGSA